MNEEITEVTSPKSNRRTMLIGGISAVLLGCCAIVVVAALVIILDPFGLNLLSRFNGRYDAAAAAMPADTGFYAGVNLLNLKPGEIGRIVNPFIEAVGDPDVENLDSAEGDFSDEVESEFGVNFETDVVPWVGQYIGFSIVDLNFSDLGGLESAQWILAVEARDKAAADEFLIKLRDGMTDSSGNSITEQSYEGVTIYVSQGSDPIEQIAFGRSDGMVIVGANVAAVQAAIDAQNGDSLAETDNYRQIISELPGSRALTFYTTGDGVRDFLTEAEDATPITVDPVTLPYLNFASTASSISIVDAGLQIDTIRYFDPDQLTTTQRALLEAGGQPLETAALFPDQTIGFISGQRLDLLWLAIREASGDVEGFDESMDAFSREFGLNPHTELFPLLNGEWAIGLIAGQSGLLAEELEVPLGISLIIGTDRPLEMADTVDAIRDGLEGQLLVVSEAETNGLNSYQVSLGETAGAAFNFGLEQDYFFIASSEDTAVELFSGGPTLAENDHYQAVQSEFSRGISLGFYLDVRALLETLREGRSGFDLENFNDTAKVFEPIEALALGSGYDNDVQRTQIIIFIESE